MSDSLIDFPAATVLHGQLVNWAKFLVELEGATVTRDQIGMLSAEKERLHVLIDGLKHERDALEASAATRQVEVEQQHAAQTKALAGEKAALQTELDAIRSDIVEAQGQLASLAAERQRIRASINAVLS